MNDSGFCSARELRKLMKSYRISPKEWLSAFSTAENRLCRTLVRRRDDFRRFCIFFISPRFGSAKIVRTEKAKTSWAYQSFVCSTWREMGRNPDGFLHKVKCFRFFCARFRRTTYACTPCATKSNTPNDFISPRLGSAAKHKPKIASAVQLYGDVTLFDASASFLSPHGPWRLKSSGPKMR